MRNHVIAMALIALGSLPAYSADASLETLLVTVKKLNGKVEVEKVGKTDYLTIHLSNTAVKEPARIPFM